MPTDTPLTCPSSYAGGCRCQEHYTLCEYMFELTGKDYGLMAAPGNVQRYVVRDLTDHCDGTMTCGCERCQGERAERLRRGRFQVRQPWEPS